MLSAFVVLLSVAGAPELKTHAETTGFRETGRYDEVVALCAGFEAAFPGRARCFSFGVTPEGREMKALVLSDDGKLDPAAVRLANRPVVFAQGGIHAGEIDGKDAGLRLARDLLDGRAAQGALSKVTFLFVPVFNVDGHERFGPNQRPNQRGPAQMGWRTTAQNLNLNRDYVKADAPEMQAMLRLLMQWDPIVALDLHVTDGAQFRHDLAVLVEPALDGPTALAAAGRKMQAAIVAAINLKGHQGLDFYPAFEIDDDPASGFSVGIPPPRLSHPYRATRNRFGVLVETHSWLDYGRRVQATYDVVAAFLSLAASEGARWMALAQKVDDEDRRGATTKVVLAYDNAEAKRTIDFLGYRYERFASAISGRMAVRYDEAAPSVWKVPLLTGVKPKVTATLPRAGYLVEAAFAPDVRLRLQAHGIAFQEVQHALEVDAEVFRAAEVEFGARPYEGRMSFKGKGTWTRERLSVAAGALFVPVRQPGARLVAHLFEPEGPDSFLAWGFFNARFEQKEYIEGYVIEAEAQRMLAADEGLRREFESKLAADEKFASSSEARRDFFYRRHPSYDRSFNLAPVYRLDVVPPTK